jgi:hypothetical protein
MDRRMVPYNSQISLSCTDNQMALVCDIMASSHPSTPPPPPILDVLPSDCPNYNMTLLLPMVVLEGTRILGSCLREDPLGSRCMLASRGPIFKFYCDLVSFNSFSPKFCHWLVRSRLPVIANRRG